MWRFRHSCSVPEIVSHLSRDLRFVPPSQTGGYKKKIAAVWAPGRQWAVLGATRWFTNEGLVFPWPSGILTRLSAGPRASVGDAGTICGARSARASSTDNEYTSQNQAKISKKHVQNPKIGEIFERFLVRFLVIWKDQEHRLWTSERETSAPALSAVHTPPDDPPTKGIGQGHLTPRL